MVSKKLTVFLLFALISELSIAQTTLRGRIFDAETGDPLPFVNVVFNERGNGFTSGLDGDFRVTANDPIRWLRVSYLGYLPRTVAVDPENSKQVLKIGLTKTSYQLKEVVVKPGINPAHRIIIAAYNNRDKNNPEKLASFRYTSYNKLYFTIDKLVAKQIREAYADTLKQVDSLSIKFEKLKQKQHLMMLETVTAREFLYPNSNSEKILASRVSGLKDPFISFIAMQIQSFSFYPEHITLADKAYLNPISAGSTKKYLFILEDTLFTPENDTLFVISYRPHRDRNFEGLMGQLTINARGYAIQSVIAEPSSPGGLLSIKIQQRYERVNDATWFPVELNTDLIITPADIKDKKDGKTISLQMMGIGKSYLKDIEINPAISRRSFSHIEVSVDPLAGERSSAYWALFRKDSLTPQELRTYRIIDSIGRKANLERRMRVLESLVTGRIPVGFVSLNLNQLIGYNRFEGYRLGIGLETNRKVSDYFQVGGYTAYGLHDRSYKYGGFTGVTFNRRYQVQLKYSYKSDVRETGTYSFGEENSFLSGSDYYRELPISVMDRIEEHRVAFSFRFLKSFKLNLSMANQSFDLLSGFYYKNSAQTDTIKSFNQAQLAATLRIASGEKFIETSRGIIPLSTDFPVFWVNYIKGLDVVDGGYEFDRVEVRFDKSYRWRTLGKTIINVDAGRVFGNVPIPLMYFGRANYLGAVTPDATHSFAAMRMNEFLADRFVSIFLKHDFGRLLWTTGSKRFQPEFAIVQNIGYGNISSNDLHVLPVGFAIEAPTKGYFETGLQANKLLSNGFMAFGFGIYYRYGSYRFSDFEDNLAYKITISLML
jgi:hypothetical protein